MSSIHCMYQSLTALTRGGHSLNLTMSLGKTSFLGLVPCPNPSLSKKNPQKNKKNTKNQTKKNSENQSCLEITFHTI